MAQSDTDTHISSSCMHSQLKVRNVHQGRLSKLIGHLKPSLCANPAKIKIGLIGLGPSGLSLLNAFNTEMVHRYSNKTIDFSITCFEQQSEIGGLWNYNWSTETSKYGESIHSAMYHDLWTNGPKECLEFCDYSFKKHFNNKNIASFPPRKVMRDYFLGRIHHKNVLNNLSFHFKFNSKVVNVDEIKENNKFKLKYKDLIKNKCFSNTFDYIIVGCGHFTTPNMVNFRGFEDFNGRIIHSKSFRNASEFRGQNIVIIGSSYSAEDIALNCWKFGANQIIISYRTSPMKFKWPNNIIELPLIDEIINKNTVKFIDGTIKKNIDSIILCTGYIHYFPFLNDNLRLITNNILYPNNLYKGCVWIKNQNSNNNLFYIGMQDQWYTFTMFDIQSFFIKDIILNNIKLPNKINMINDIKKWMKKEIILKKNGMTDEGCITFQTEYIQDVYKQLLQPTYYVDDIHKLDCSKQFMEWENNKHNDVVSHRDNVHKSNITGITAAKFHTAWKDAFDDSIECFLRKE